LFEELKPHLIELRKRIIFSVAFLVVMFFVCFNFHEQIFALVMRPINGIMPNEGKMIFTHPAESFFVAIKVAFFAAFVISIPVILYEIWAFVAPGLYENEKKYVVPFVVAASFMFLLGAAFCYFLVVPIAFNFLLNFGGQDLVAMPKISEFIGFFIKLIIAFGISFELPVVTFFLALMGIVTAKGMAGFFRYAIVGIFVFAAIMTPPDILSQILLAVPLILLYGLSIIIARIVNPEKSDESK